MKAGFRGPLFIVGMSRSGTKLIRDLLNRNPRVGLPEAESHFLPYVIREIIGTEHVPGTRSSYRFGRFLTRSSFCERMSGRGCKLSGKELREALQSTSWGEVLERVFRFYGGIEQQPDAIWGDKTPRNLRNMRLLKDFFPNAKFVHIVRDPRDRVVSVRNAWGGNVHLSADDWCRSMEKARVDAASLGDDYYELRYEALISNPETELQNLCRYLGIEFSPAMLELQRPVENQGDTGSQTRKSLRIVADNAGRYLKNLSPKELMRLEQILFPTAASYGYEACNQQTQHKPLRYHERVLWSIPHRWNSLRLHLRRWGVLKGIRHAFFRVRA